MADLLFGLGTLSVSTRYPLYEETNSKMIYCSEIRILGENTVNYHVKCIYVYSSCTWGISACHTHLDT